MSNQSEEERIKQQIEYINFTRQGFIKKYLSKLIDQKDVGLVMKNFNFEKLFNHKASELQMMNNFSQSTLLRMTSNSLPKQRSTQLEWQAVQLKSFDKTNQIFEELQVCMNNESKKQQKQEGKMNCIKILNEQIENLIDDTQNKYKEIITKNN